MIEAVIIDLDDTLCLTEAATFQMENEALQSLGRAPMPRELHRKTWGKPLFEIIATRSPGVDVAGFRVAFAPIIAEYVRAGKLDAITSDNFRALDRLAELGKRLFLLTSREHAELGHLLRPGHELGERITAFYYRDNMEFHKPDPRAFTKLLDDHVLQSAACVYVGDSPSDAAAANGAGIRFIASLESDLRTREDFQSYQVGAFIQTFPEVVAAVQQLDNA
jgi:phosphoglycolate phosphatase